MVQAFKQWQSLNPNADVSGLTEQALTPFLSTGDMPEVDLLVRTGGEQRVSNFLLWQSAYAELYFSEVLWPDFDEKELEAILRWYSQRTRRFGLTSEQVEKANAHGS